MSGSVLRGTSSATRTMDERQIAALRPAVTTPKRQRKAAAPKREVAGGIVCFCGERFSEAQALEFMKHLRAEVGEDLATLERKRQLERKRTREYLQRKRAEDPEWREQERARKRAQEHRRNETDPEWRERERARKRIAQARNRADPEWRARVNEQRREAWAANPERRERRLAYGRERRARKKAEADAGVAP